MKSKEREIRSRLRVLEHTDKSATHLEVRKIVPRSCPIWADAAQVEFMAISFP
jgi:hypothetical protein